MPHSRSPISRIATLDASYHADPNKLFNAAASTSVEQIAAQLNAEQAFRFHGSYHEDDGGMGEKWFKGSGGWYYIKPNGSLHKYDGGSISRAKQFAVLDIKYHANPSLLMQAAES